MICRQFLFTSIQTRTTQIGIRYFQCLLCLNLINVIIVLGRSLRFRRAVAVQRIHAVERITVSSTW